MALTCYSCKFVVDNAPQLHDQARNVTRNLATNIGGRRRLLLSSTAATLLAAETTDADSRTALLQKYLKRTEENKAKNDKERLDGYYKRNYKDYFGFVEGNLKSKDKEQLSESERGILDWLEKNK
ncbi:Photosystem I reaction center subunit N chloroplastic [Bienertia sinuspersici]